MTPATFAISLDGGVLERGFWLYAWEVTSPDGRKLIYVGRTGDSSSPNAQSPFVRMGQHLGSVQSSSMLRNHLGHRRIDPERCSFRLIAYGPIRSEAADMDAHKESRDVVAAMERKLADDLTSAGYEVMNHIACHKPLDRELYAAVRAAFAAELVGLTAGSTRPRGTGEI